MPKIVQQKLTPEAPKFNETVTPKLVEATPEPEEVALSIAEPTASALDRFMVTCDADIANVGTLLSPLPVHGISQAKDYVRLHPTYVSGRLRFVNIPIIGQARDTTHLITEKLAKRYLEAAEVDIHALALATLPNDRFFLCTVPTQHLDNVWNADALVACELAKTRWVKVTSRRAEGVEGYKTKFARSEKAFPEPKWPSQTLNELILVTFAARMIDRDDHPGLLRLLGAEQSLR